MVNLTDWNYSKDFERINCTSFIIWFYAKWRRKLCLIQNAAVKPSLIPVQFGQLRFWNFKFSERLFRWIVTWKLVSCDSRGLSRSELLFGGNLINQKMTLIYTRNAFKWLRLTDLDCFSYSELNELTWFWICILSNLLRHWVNRISSNELVLSSSWS